MSVYFPFLKLKQNEILGVGTLSDDTRAKICPCFDVPRTSKNQNADEILDRVRIGLTKMTSLCERIGTFPFYIDNFDLDDDLELEGTPQYRYILATFKPFRAIPIIALDRHVDHNPAAFEYLLEVGGPVGVRLQLEDIESWTLLKRKLVGLWGELTRCKAQRIDVIVDARVLTDYATAATRIAEFLKNFRAEFYAHTFVVTGSSIPSNISELIETGGAKMVPRLEYHLWRHLVAEAAMHDVRFGDYGVVSPEYSDVELQPELLRTISTPRAFYPHGDSMLAVRGISFKAHPLGNGQYFEIADLIQRQPFFRGASYSFGDQYIYDRSASSAKRPAKAGNAGSWVKSTLASHITYLGDVLLP
ncbi:beta family protein [Cupriavidus cauae]|uniref:T4 beta protein n=1 Tax=Cupriavidus cauae TaxID=2608999 RepID=A0A5M8ANH2_9BURK|nr:hypothetical protein [Cupriavidus cauae]KAA6123120.1 hypothetical protein F1599_14660 [Cupriavidus cauae]UZN51664.1 beta family protein [Cupriavidus cauae]